jgi:hypothetical protein
MEGLVLVFVGRMSTLTRRKMKRLKKEHTLWVARF